MPSWDQLDKPSLLMAAGVALLAAVFLRLAYRRMARSKRLDQPNNGAVAAPFLSLERSRDSHATETCQAPLFDTARELSAQLESKMIALEEWIRLARLEAERLERAVAAARAFCPLEESAREAKRIAAERVP